MKFIPSTQCIYMKNDNEIYSKNKMYTIKNDNEIYSKDKMYTMKIDNEIYSNYTRYNKHFW